MKYTERTIVLHKQAHNETFGVYIGEDFPFGIYIITIEAGSPAAISGIRAGDRIISVNGQLVSEMKTNPKEIIAKIASASQSLTLLLQPTTIHDFVEKISENVATNHAYRYNSSSLQQNKVIDSNLENYITGLFPNESLQIVSSKPGDPYEFDLISDRDPSQPVLLNKSIVNETREIPMLSKHELKDDIQPSYQQRSTSNMDTTNLVLKHSLSSTTTTNENDQLPSTTLFQKMQVITKDPQTYTDETGKNNRVSFHDNMPGTQQNLPQAQPIIPLLQPSTPVSQGIPASLVMPEQQSHPPEYAQQVQPVGQPDKPILPIDTEGFRVIHLERSSNSNLFGFDVQFNQSYYLVSNIEHHSPAEQGGLRLKDVITKVDNQPLDLMPYTTFLDIINRKKEVTLEVQELNAFLRARPTMLRQISSSSTTKTDDKNSEQKGQEQKSVLSRMLSKITSR